MQSEWPQTLHTFYACCHAIHPRTRKRTQKRPHKNFQEHKRRNALLSPSPCLVLPPLSICRCTSGLEQYLNEVPPHPSRLSLLHPDSVWDALDVERGAAENRECVCDSVQLYLGLIGLFMIWVSVEQKHTRRNRKKSKERKDKERGSKERQEVLSLAQRVHAVCVTIRSNATLSLSGIHRALSVLWRFFVPFRTRRLTSSVRVLLDETLDQLEIGLREILSIRHMQRVAVDSPALWIHYERWTLLLGFVLQENVQAADEQSECIFEEMQCLLTSLQKRRSIDPQRQVKSNEGCVVQVYEALLCWSLAMCGIRQRTREENQEDREPEEEPIPRPDVVESFFEYCDSSTTEEDLILSRRFLSDWRLAFRPIDTSITSPTEILSRSFLLRPLLIELWIHVQREIARLGRE